MENICKDCRDKTGDYKTGDYMHSSGEYVCADCVGNYRACETCGLLFDEGDALYWTSENRCPDCGG